MDLLYLDFLLGLDPRHGHGAAQKHAKEDRVGVTSGSGTGVDLGPFSQIFHFKLFILSSFDLWDVPARVVGTHIPPIDTALFNNFCVVRKLDAMLLSPR